MIPPLSAFNTGRGSNSGFVVVCSIPENSLEPYAIDTPNPLYDEKKNLEETYEPYLTKDVIPSFWVLPDSKPNTAIVII